MTAKITITDRTTDATSTHDPAKETPSSGSERRPCSPSSGEDSVWHAEYLKASDRAIRMEIERNDARRDRDEWKASSEQYHRANASLDKAWSEMLALLRRIARKGEFMDREGLRITVSDWLAHRHLLPENETSLSVGATETKP